MRLQKRLPRCRPFWHRWNAVRLQDPRDRRPADSMADVLQRADDSGVAPRRILRGHAHHQTPDLGQHARTTASGLRVRPLAGNQLSMPPENRVGRDDRRDRAEAATAQPVSVHRQPTPFLIGKADPPTHVRTEDAVFFDQVRQGILLPLVEPAAQRGQQYSKRQGVEHGGRVYTTDRISGLRTAVSRAMRHYASSITFPIRQSCASRGSMNSGLNVPSTVIGAGPLKKNSIFSSGVMREFYFGVNHRNSG